jgi:hypothetical protein
MDIDSKCYDLIAGAGLEPILQGGRGRASGFIMRMMAENKLKHKGDYKNPTSPLDPNSEMNAPVAFDYRKLANRSQKGKSKSKYGASPFIIKHFANQPVPFRSRAQRLAEGDSEAEVPGETDEQKEARLRTTAERLLEKARELAGLRETKGKAATKIQSLSKIRKSMKFVKGLKAEKGKAAAEAKAKADAAAKAEADAKAQRARYKRLYGHEPDTPAQAVEARRRDALKAIGIIPMSEAEREREAFFAKQSARLSTR